MKSLTDELILDEIECVDRTSNMLGHNGLLIQIINAGMPVTGADVEAVADIKGKIKNNQDDKLTFDEIDRISKYFMAHVWNSNGAEDLAKVSRYLANKLEALKSHNN